MFVDFFNIRYFPFISRPLRHLRSLTLASLLWITYLASVTHAQDRAPLLESSRSLADFLSRVHASPHLEPGDSVMLHSLAIRGLAHDHAHGLTKCGTTLLGQARALHNPKDTWLGKIQSTPPVHDTFVTSPGGMFKVHYLHSGDAAAKTGYALAIGRYAEEAFDFEINTLGFAKPPYSFGDSTYNIYLLNTGAARVYGWTDEVTDGMVLQSPSGEPRVRTFMVLDNDYLDEVFVTRGLDAARITVFHEFHHMVQFGSYGRDNRESYMQEMTATWMEMLADPEVDDYIQYIPGFIEENNLTLRFDRSPGGGYGQAIWLEYLASKFGRDIVREIWERYRDVQPDGIFAMAEELRERGSAWSCEYAKFGEELFFTGRRTRLTSPFSDASKFPIDAMTTFVTAPGAPLNVNDAMEMSLHLVTTGFAGDTVVLSIARDTARLVNADIISVIIDGPSSYSVVYGDPERFCAVFGEPFRTDADVFPQPFVLEAGASGVHILVASARPPVTTSLGIHSLSMDEIVTLTGPVESKGGRYYVNWDGHDAAGKPVPSGIYLYRADADGEERTGKIVVVRR